jgi:hypothetical protein
MIEQTISWGDIFTGLAFFLSLFATAMSLWSNHKQNSLWQSQERLNNMLLQQGEREQLNASKADIGATFVKLGGGNYRLKIFNKGKAPARNVRIELPDDDDVIIASDINEIFPLESLEHLQSVELIAAPHLGSKLKHTIRLLWADDASENNEKKMHLTL